jgi:hypothetical protein
MIGSSRVVEISGIPHMPAAKDRHVGLGQVVQVATSL